MANRKQTPGIIGLGSRLFVGKETAWGTAVIDIDQGGAEGGAAPRVRGRPSRPERSPGR